MARPDAVILSGDEFTIRPQLVVWLGYPSNPRMRDNALRHIQSWAAVLAGLKLQERTSRGKQADTALSKLERMVDRQLLAGEVFRHQVLASLPDDIGFFGNTSTQAFARRVEAYGDEMEGVEFDQFGRRPLKLSERNAKRDLWAARRPGLALAVGACTWWPPHAFTLEDWQREPRPSLESLLFTNQDWALQAVRYAERIRQLAITQGHVAASELVEFRTVGF